MADVTDLNTYPIPSSDLNALERNAKDFDKALNAGNTTFQNRAGVTLPTYQRALQDYGTFNNTGLWVTAKLYSVNDLWQSNIDGTWYVVLEGYTSGVSEAADIASGNVAVYQAVYGIQHFDSVADMVASTSLAIGQKVRTLGYYSTGDGGGNDYEIVAAATGTDDGGSYIDLTGISGQAKGLFVDGVVNVKQFGAKGDGINNDTASISSAISLQSTSGVSVEISSGQYLVDTVKIEHDDACVIFNGDVSLVANSANSILFHQAASYARHRGTFNAVGNGKSTIYGMACAPSDLNSTTVLSQVNHNEMPGIHANSDIYAATYLKNGPRVGGSDSGCFYNVFTYGRCRGSVGLILIDDSADLVTGPPCNRNRFYNYRAGTGGGISPNFGLYLKAGDTNSFVNCDFEGIGSGSAQPGPFVTPTGIVIEDSSATGYDNNHNIFLGGTCEANIRDLDIRNINTYLVGLGYADSKSVFPNGTPVKRITARDNSVSSSVLNGFRAIDDNNIAFDAVTIGDALTPGSGSNRYAWDIYPLNTTTVSQGGSLIPAVAQTSSYFRKLFGMITWHFRFAFTANNAAGDVSIPLPISAQNNLYVAPGSAQTMKFPIRISDGTTQQLWYAEINGTNLVIPSPGAWNTGGNVNIIWAQIEYQQA